MSTTSSIASRSRNRTAPWTAWMRRRARFQLLWRSRGRSRSSRRSTGLPRRPSGTEGRMERTAERCLPGRGSTRMDPAAPGSEGGEVRPSQVRVCAPPPDDSVISACAAIRRLQVSQPGLRKHGGPAQHWRGRRRPLGRSSQRQREPERADRGGVGQAAGRHAERPGEAPHPGGSDCQPGQSGLQPANINTEAPFERHLRTLDFSLKHSRQHCFEEDFWLFYLSFLNCCRQGQCPCLQRVLLPRLRRRIGYRGWFPFYIFLFSSVPVTVLTFPDLSAAFLVAFRHFSTHLCLRPRVAVRGAVANSPLRAQEEEVFLLSFSLMQSSGLTCFLLLYQANQLNVPSVRCGSEDPRQSVTLDANSCNSH